MLRTLLCLSLAARCGLCLAFVLEETFLACLFSHSSNFERKGDKAGHLDNRALKNYGNLSLLWTRESGGCFSRQLPSNG